MISGAGMLDFLACQSAEKLVIDAETIGMVQRMLKGMLVQTEPLATAMFEGINFKGDFLKQKITRQLVTEEQFMPSAVIDRGSIRTWQQGGELDTFARAKQKVAELLKAYQPPELPQDKVEKLRMMVESRAKQAGMDRLPPLN
jgi:trimethylamine--corrinoid protein Co-methyltransferase